MALFTWLLPAVVLRRLERQASAPACVPPPGPPAVPRPLPWHRPPTRWAAFCTPLLRPQMFSRYAAEHWQRLSSEAAAGAQEGSVAGGPPPSDAGASPSSSPRASPSASRTSSGSLGASDASGGGPGLWRRAAELSRGWRLQHAREQVAAQRQGGAAQAPPPELGHSRFDSWGVSLLLAGLCWHAIDTLL